MSTLKRTIYRTCSCGETAHDDTGRLLALATVYACRNCRKERTIDRARSYMVRLRHARAVVAQAQRAWETSMGMRGKAGSPAEREERDERATSARKG